MKKLLVLMLLVFSLGASAGIYIEPSAGYSPLLLSRKVFGVKAGMSMMGFQAGVDLSTGSMTGNVSTYVNTLSTSIDRTEMGVFVGYQLPILLRVWASYYFSSKWSVAGTQLFKGAATSFGVSFSPIPIPVPFVGLNFNIEFRTMTLDLGSYPEIIASVSVPINI